MDASTRAALNQALDADMQEMRRKLPLGFAVGNGSSDLGPKGERGFEYLPFLQQKLQAKGVKVRVMSEMEGVLMRAHAFYSVLEREIAVPKGISGGQLTRLLVHEFAHALTHEPIMQRIGPFTPYNHGRMIHETVAETVTSLVCRRLSVPTHYRSLSYIRMLQEATKVSGPEVIEAWSDVIREAVVFMLDGLDSYRQTETFANTLKIRIQRQNHNR